MLPPRHRLRQASDLAYVRRKGRRWQSGRFVLVVASHHEDGPPQPTRFAFVAGRRVGSAVVRNRTKRRMREIVRHVLPELDSGYDCMMIARPHAALSTFAEMEADILGLLGRAHLLNSSRPLVASS